MADRNLLKTFVLEQLGIEVNSGNRKEVEMLLKMLWEHEKDQWEAKYEAELDKLRFTESEVMSLKDFVSRFHELINHKVITGVSFASIQSRITSTGQDKIALLIDIDATKFIKE